MAQESKADRLKRIHREAMVEFDQIQAALRNERLMCLQDRRFYSLAGAQWEGPLGELFENKPRFEFNKVHLALIRIFSEYRNNRITVDFTPKDGTPDDQLADTCDGLYRADEKACTAEEAYDNSFEEGVGGGFGAWRLRAVYENEDDEEDDSQRIAIEPIFDADTCVFFDLNAKRQDKADAKRCYVLTPYTYDAFTEEFGHDPATWPKDIKQTEFDWSTPEIVWVCEHYRVEEKSEVVRYFRGLDENAEDMRVTQSQIDEDPEMLDELQATGFREVRQKRIKTRVVRKYLLSGLKVEEDCGQIAGKCIPIIPFYGKRWVVDGVERCMGHVRLAKDAQRLINMLLSWLAEMAGRFDIEKPILSPAQIKGHATMWAEDNIKKFPYLLANPEIDTEGNPIPGSQAPAAYTKAPNIPPAMAALVELAGRALEDMLGNQQAGEQIQPNVSGKVIELVQNRLDMQVFIYMSNLAKAMKRSGEVWLSMMKDIVVEEGRRMKTISSDGQPGSVVMNQPQYDEDKAEEYLANDISEANFDVDVSVGPSSSSLRSSVVRSLTAISATTDDPEMKRALTLATIANLDGEGLGDLRDWGRARAIRMGLIKPTDEEAQQLAQERATAQPDAQTVYLMKAADAEEAKAAKARADTVETIASADLKHAQTAKTIAETQGAHTQQAINVADALQRAAAPPPGVDGIGQQGGQ